jgi:hypothetical protein
VEASASSVASGWPTSLEVVRDDPINEDE